MASSPRGTTQMEELRRQLYRGFGSQYDPVRLQALATISEEFDRLAVELARQELDREPEPVKRV